MSETTAPTAALASKIAARAAGSPPTAVRRFATGSHHYVYEAVFAAAAPLVVRLSRPEDRAIVQSAARLSRQLRTLGAPLPTLIEDGSAEPVPYLLLERLAGEDLGAVAARLDEGALQRVAARVAEAQALVAGLPSAGRYGYAGTAEQAPFATWAEVLEASIARTRGWIIAAGLYDEAAPDALAVLVERHRSELADVPATPFLHDTTTKNVIVTREGQFSGIVDVDDLCYGDPRFPAALTLAALLESGGPAEYVETWMRLAGWRNDRVFRLYVALFLADFMGGQGQAFNGNPVVAPPAARERLAALFRRIAASVEAR